LEGFYLFVQTADYNFYGPIIAMCNRVDRPGIRKEIDWFLFPYTKNSASGSARLNRHSYIVSVICHYREETVIFFFTLFYFNKGEPL
jgi:hypothetical protein